MYAEQRLSVRETARRLGVHENTVRNWEERGFLRAVRLPGSGYRRFDLAEVERLRTEMLADLPPAVEGPVIRPSGAKRIVRGDEE
jgi:excisionase family DNA binding protein